MEFFCADAAEAAARFARLIPKRETNEEKDGGDGFFAPLRMTGEGDGFFAPLGMTGEGDGFLAPLGMTGGVDVIVVDPPRKGLAPEVIDAMVTMAPARIVYVSCDPATLARDVKMFSQQGYSLTHAEAFDLFPRTFHVETVVLMSRGGL